jgi:hypothetical protein
MAKAVQGVWGCLGERLSSTAVHPPEEVSYVLSVLVRRDTPAPKVWPTVSSHDSCLSVGTVYS